MKLTNLLATMFVALVSAVACGSDNNAGNGNDGDKTRLATPQIAVQAESVTASAFVIEWAPVANAASYLCRLDNGTVTTVYPAFQTDAANPVKETVRFAQLLPSHTYTVEVQALAFAGSEFDHSVAVTLRVTTAEAPVDGDVDEGDIPDGYVLVWNDEFNGDALNSESWNIQIDGNGGGNNELEYYTDRTENVRIGIEPASGRSCLVLTARKESYAGKTATSGRVNTEGKRQFLYGRFDALIKLPATANGLWPAYWMLGDDFAQVGWPRSGEIDILEMGHSNGIKNGTQDRFFNGAAHWGPAGGHYQHAQDATWDYSLQDGEFHLYTLIWDETALKTYVDLDRYPDREPYFAMNITKGDGSDADVYNYFHKPYHLLFNLAVGGDFTGIHDINAVTALAEGEASMYVDYIRVFAKTE